MIKYKMKNFKQLYNIILLIISPSLLFSDIINKDDLNFLNFNDKKVFTETCLKKENLLDIPKCLNFFGLKILINNFNNPEISQETLKYIEKQSVNYLKEAAERGYAEAYKNLGWIYSNDKFELQDFKKSAKYFELHQNIKNKNLQAEKESQIELIRNQIYSGILVMQKLDLYKKYNLDNENYYLTDREYKKGKIIFSEIIELSNLSVEELGELKENFLKENNSILNNLENNLRNFKKKYRRIAIKELNQLSEILEGLN